jgi:DhnA family fructose-bisphosphate aldolase class Ia
MKPNDARGGYQGSTDKSLMAPLIRQARELGADIIKADPTEHPEDYHEVIEAARCPVLVRGGGKEPVETVFDKAYAYLAQGAMGLVYGRNVYQHPNPSKIVKALMAMIHKGATAREAWDLYSKG